MLEAVAAVTESDKISSKSTKLTEYFQKNDEIHCTAPSKMRIEIENVDKNLRGKVNGSSLKKVETVKTRR